MGSHRLRLISILIAWAILAIGLIVLIGLGQTEGTGFGVITGAFSVATPALFDALAVERRRRSPERVTVTDDVRPKPEA